MRLALDARELITVANRPTPDLAREHHEKDRQNVAALRSLDTAAKTPRVEKGVLVSLRDRRRETTGRMSKDLKF
jgi:hypothetical protein